jgi:hypothetical protein
MMSWLKRTNATATATRSAGEPSRATIACGMPSFMPNSLVHQTGKGWDRMTSIVGGMRT